MYYVSMLDLRLIELNKLFILNDYDLFPFRNWNVRWSRRNSILYVPKLAFRFFVYSIQLLCL